MSVLPVALSLNRRIIVYLLTIQSLGLPWLGMVFKSRPKISVLVNVSTL